MGCSMQSSRRSTQAPGRQVLFLGPNLRWTRSAEQILNSDGLRLQSKSGVHCSKCAAGRLSVDLTGPAQNFPSKLRSLPSAFHQSGAEGPVRMADIEPGTARLSARQGTPWGVILTEPTEAPALSFADRVGPQLLHCFLVASRRRRRQDPQYTCPSAQGPKYPSTYLGHICCTRAHSDTPSPIPNVRTLNAAVGL